MMMGPLKGGLALLQKHLREADASLLALLRESDPTSQELTPLDEAPSPPPVTSKSEVRLLEAAASTNRVRLKDELSLYVSNAEQPLGAQLCLFIDEFRRDHGPPPESAAPAPSATTTPRLLEKLPQIPLLWRLRRTREIPASVPLGAAVRAAGAALAELRATLSTQLPTSLRDDPSALHEGGAQLESAFFRAVQPSMARLYEKAHADEISVLAQRCHELRQLLPCDLLHLPPDVWLLPDGDGASAAAARLTALRDAAVSNALLPYASAIQVRCVPPPRSMRTSRSCPLAPSPPAAQL